MISALKIRFWVLLAFFFLPAQVHSLEVIDRGSSIEILDGFPLDISLSRLVEAYYKAESAQRQGDRKGYQEGVDSYQQSARRLIAHILDEDLILKTRSFLVHGDALIQAGLLWFQEELVGQMNVAVSQGRMDLTRYNDGISVADAAELFPRPGLQAKYEYAYGRELQRDVLEEFEVIHRHTYMENYEHKIDIEIDFLGPIKKVLSGLHLEKRFEWLYKQRLRYGYHAYFKHYKKVFTRATGYYGKLRLTLELLRRKRRWWGSSEWEVIGATTQIHEEPRALVATEARILD